jgi:hypothetical protein
LFVSGSILPNEITPADQQPFNKKKLIGRRKKA